MATKKETQNSENTQKSFSWRKAPKADSVPTPDPDLGDIKYQESMRYNQDTRQRKMLVIWVATLISVWLAAILAIVCLDGSGEFDYDNTVMVALLATTTTNIVALGFIILKGLFGDVNIK